MAGVGKNAVIVDVPAAARKVLADNRRKTAKAEAPVPSAASEPIPLREPLQESAPHCALGHESPEGTRFCAQCGLPVGTGAPGQAVVDAGPPKPEAMLTPEEKAERERQHMEAVAMLREAEARVPDIDKQPDPSEKKILIHFVADGFTWAGKVWYRGEQLEIGPEHPRWESAVGWILLDKRQQVERYGRVIFDTGPWPYGQLPPGTEVPLPSADYSQIARRGAAPARAGESGSLIPM